MTYSDTTKAWTTTDEKSGSSISFTVNDDKVRTFNFTLNGHTYALSEADGDYTLSVDSNAMYPVASTDSAKATATAKYLPDHTSHNITAMTHYGLTVIGSEAESGAAAGLATSHYHYEECKDCGLAYHKVTVAEGAEGKFDSDGLCKVCGAAQTATGWADITITSTKLAAAGAPILIVKEGTEIELPEGSFRVFNGLTYDIEEDTLWTLNDKLGVSGGKVVVSETGAVATFTDKVDE